MSHLVGFFRQVLSLVLWILQVCTVHNAFWKIFWKNIKCNCGNNNTERKSHGREFCGNKILLDHMFSQMKKTRVESMFMPFYCGTLLATLLTWLTLKHPHPRSLVVNEWTTRSPWTTHLQCGKAFQKHHNGSEVRMIKTVDTPSSLVKKRRFHGTNTDNLAMDRILGQKSAGFLNGWDTATKFSKWKMNSSRSEVTLMKLCPS